ncbi:MAG: hypothetical protein M1840_000826 [Geoglossum simile]|nr:MAG: hypothetical protein M1840_000826 [Geoglossum simile]
MRVYLITGSSNVQKFFRSSKSLIFENFVANVTEMILGMPAADAQILREDSSGRGAVPLGAVSERGRIWHKIVEISHSNLHDRKSLSLLATRWISKFLQEVDALHTPSGEEWVEAPIYGFIRGPMLRASVSTILGPRWLEECPTFERDLWAFDGAFLKLLIGAPRFLCRKGWDARKNLLSATKRWLARGWEDFDWQDEKMKDVVWEVIFGHKIVREREMALREYGVSLDGRTAFEFGLIWASVINSIPATGWVLIEILRDPELYRRVRAEIVVAGAVTIDKSTGATHFDGAKAASMPLLQSVYQECLRLYMSIPVVRSLRNDIEIDGYILRAGNAIITPTYLAHHNPSVWSTPDHPAHAFWADRFMRNSNDPNESGKKDPGDYFPFGGGLNICPGRHRGKDEILAAVAVLLTNFEFEFVSHIGQNGRPTAQEPGPLNIENYQSRGVVQPDRDILVRMRRVGLRKREVGHVPSGL